MDQVKEYLKLAVKHRFWIAVAIAALLPVIGFFLASGSIQAEEQKIAASVKSGYDNVKKFESRGAAPVNNQYSPLVEKETAVLQKDVNESWRKLYERQAPLLTWPSEVVDTIPIWGRKYPEELAANVVRDAVTAYIETYEPYVETVYKSFQPFDPVTGEGIVAAPPKEMLLQPATFDITTPPSLGKVWAAQERLWVQRTVLDVLAKVNERAGAKTWIEAPLKQVLELQVATDSALDQQSLAQGKTLTEAPDVLSAAEAARAAETQTASTAAPDIMGGGGMSQMGRRGMMAEMGGGGVGGAAVDPAVVKYLESANADQVFIAPIYLSVYIEQDAIPNLLVEFQNSPMNIQIREIGILKPPPHSVKKPVKGQNMSMGFGMMMGGRGSMMGDMLAGGYGGGMAQYMAGANASSAGGYGGGMNMAYMQGRRGGGAGGYGGGMDPRAGRAGGGMAPQAEKRQGVSVRDENIAKIQAKKKAEEDKAKKDEESGAVEEPTTGTDPYFDVVEVRIYGQARFYKTPPKEETTESESAAAITDGAPAGDSEPAATTDATPAATPETPAPAEAATPAPTGETPAEAPPAAEGTAPAGDAPTPESPAPAADSPAPAPATTPAAEPAAEPSK